MPFGGLFRNEPPDKTALLLIARRRGQTLPRMRAPILEAGPKTTEESKWRGTKAAN